MAKLGGLTSGPVNRAAPRARPDHPHPRHPPLPHHRHRAAPRHAAHHLHTRLLQPGLAHLTDPAPPLPSRLRTAARNYQNALDQLTQEAGLAA
ncbi:MAG: hypothetical protein ACRDT0_20565, partial [Pseudonocardiaceae bacterium]